MFPEFAWAGQGNMGCGSKNEWRKSGTTLLIMWLLGYAFSLISGYVIILYRIPSYSRAYVCIIETWWVTKTYKLKRSIQLYFQQTATIVPFMTVHYRCPQQQSKSTTRLHPYWSKNALITIYLTSRKKMQLEQIISYLHELYGRKVIEGMTFD